MSQVLVDSSVWIEYFTSDTAHTAIDTLIDENSICTNELILTELLPFLHAKKEYELMEALYAIENVRLEIRWDVIRQMQIRNISHGINKVGIPDLIILQNVIENDLVLYTIDRHFTLMQKLFDFELY